MDHIRCYSRVGSLFLVCEHCSKEKQIELPITVSSVNDQVKDFKTIHRRCLGKEQMG